MKEGSFPGAARQEKSSTKIRTSRYVRNMLQPSCTNWYIAFNATPLISKVTPEQSEATARQMPLRTIFVVKRGRIHRIARKLNPPTARTRGMTLKSTVKAIFTMRKESFFREVSPACGAPTNDEPGLGASVDLISAVIHYLT